MARTNKQVKKEKSADEVREFRISLTETYAKSGLERSQEDIAKDNNITPKCMREMMDEAIIYAEVSLEIANMVKSKAEERAKIVLKQKLRSVQEAANKSRLHHEDLIKKREEYLLTSVSRADTKLIAEYCANNPTKSISQITKKFKLESERMTKLILKKSIVENVVSDEIVELIIKRSLGKNPSEKSKQIFETFITKRNNYKESH